MRPSAAVIHVEIDGRPYECEAGSTILSALRQRGIDLPAFCHDDRLQPSGACRSCLVDVSGAHRLVPACTTVVDEGMTVRTNTPEIESHRRTLLGMLASRYPMGAAARYPDKPFHQALLASGVECGGPPVPEGKEGDRSHPYIAVDMSRCIECYRCVRICDEVQGERVWHVRARGLETRIVPDGPTLLESSCVSCGACVDTCPTGALDDAAASPCAAPLEWTRTTCPYCGVGCEMYAGTAGGEIVSIRPALDAPVNKGHLCVKGRYAHGFVHAGDRVTEPMIRERSRWRQVSWEEACAFVAARLGDIVKRHGPDAVGMLGSARATNEDNYVAQKFARTVIGTNNIDCCARVCHAPSAAALKQMLGAGLATNSFDDIERARAILVCGANPTEAHPVVGARIRQAARRGVPLIVVDPRQIDLAGDAACHLAPEPGTNVALLNAMAHVIIEEGLVDREFLDERVEGVDEFQRSIREWTPERAASICGVEPAHIRAAARLYGANRPAMAIHGLGLTEHVQGTEGVMSLINLALLTGSIGKPGGGINPLRGQNNVQGAAHMGCDPDVLPGSLPLDEGRALFEERWGTPLARTKGLNVLAMIDGAAAGSLKALWTIGYDLLFTSPNARHTAEAFAGLELVVVQDLFLNETAREFGTVFLPACSSFEKEGTFMNAERRIERVRAAMPAAGGSKADWQIVAAIARALRHPGFAFATAEEIWDEVRELCAGARGMTYRRLDCGGLQWPCPSEDHPGTPILHVSGFGHGPRATLRCVEHHPTTEQATPEYPFLLSTGRSLFQFNAGTMTSRTLNAVLRPSDTLDISPEDAAAAGVAEGDRVRVTSAYGETVVPAHLSAAMARGQLFSTFHDRRAFVNRLTSGNRDAVTGTPEYKVTAVRVERVRA